jgi:PKD domain
MVALVAVAYADNVQNDVVAGGNDTIVSADSTNIRYWIQPTGGTCDAADGSPATVAINGPAAVVRTPSSLVFTACNTQNQANPNNTQTVNLTSTTLGAHAMTAPSVVDSSGTYNGQPAAFTLKVNPRPPSGLLASATAANASAAWTRSPDSAQLTTYVVVFTFSLSGGGTSTTTVATSGTPPAATATAAWPSTATSSCVTVKARFTQIANNYDSSIVGPECANRPPSNQAPTASAGGPYSVGEGSSVTLAGSGTDPDGDALIHTWDLDNNGTFETPGQNATFSAAGRDGPSSQTVVLQVCDPSSACDTDSVSVSITNVPPTASINGAPPSSPEGTLISLTGSFTDPGSTDTHAQAWAVTKNGSAYASGSGNSFSFTPDDNGSYVVSYTVTDDDSGVGTDTKTINVTNESPVASINGAPASSPEGTLISLTGSFTDPGSADTHIQAWAVTKDGSPYGSGTGASFTFTPDDNGSYVATYTVTDDDGGVGTATKTVNVTNVAPTINSFAIAKPSGAACQGTTNTVTVSFTVFDPATETYDPITGTINWGDGSAAQAIAGRTISESHSYAAGSYVVNVSVNDGDGGTASAGGSSGGAVSLLYATSGILQPINADKSSNFRLGSTFPIKIRVTDCSGASVGTLAPEVGLTRTGTGTGAPNEAVPESVPDDGNDMRYDAGGQQYIYNLSSKRSTLVDPAGAPLPLGTYEVRVFHSTFAPAKGYFDIVK